MKIQFWKYLIAFVIGGVLVIAEIFGLVWFNRLGYEGHMFGYGIMAVAVCGLAISIPIERPNRIIHFDSAISGLIYVLMNPIYYGLVILLLRDHLDFIKIIRWSYSIPYKLPACPDLVRHAPRQSILHQLGYETGAVPLK